MKKAVSRANPKRRTQITYRPEKEPKRKNRNKEMSN
jgi:hypothetical protein